MPCPLQRAAGQQHGLQSTQSVLDSPRAPCICLRSKPQLSLRRAGPFAAARAPSRIGSVVDGHKTHVAVQQRHGVSSEAAHHGQQHQHSHSHSHHAAGSSSDDSVRIIMLLSLSLTLMLLPWMSRHPEFLIAPLLLAITPVVGNGVRPVLKEVGSGLLTTLKLSLGLLTHHDQHQQLPGGHHNSHSHHHSHQHHSHSNHRQQQQQHQQQQQQQQVYSQYAQQQQQPAGPYSPWPNPEQQQQPAGPYSPWPAAAAAATRAPSEADSDWAPSSPPDPHQADPHSQQHLQQLLAADMQVEQELGRPAAAAAGPRSSSSPGRGSPSSRSPAGSPTSSVDGLAAAAPDLLQQQQHGHHHVRDPRVLSREAKQQLYHNHSQYGAGGQQQQQQQQQQR